MNYLSYEEKKLKSFLKKKVSFDLQTLVKFLITGVIAVSVTACGGGGGGSSPASNNPVDKNTGNVTNSIVTENKTYINDGTIKIDSSAEKNSYALAGKNSKIINNNIISITEKESTPLDKTFVTPSGIDELNDLLNQGYNIGVFAQGGDIINEKSGEINVDSKKGIGVYLSGAKLKNNGNINMSGKLQVDEQNIISSENIGICANNNSEVINNGKITLNTTINDIVYKGNYPPTLAYSIGILGENGSNIENRNLIVGTGNIIGMKAISNSLASNIGDINLTSSKIKADVIYEKEESSHTNFNGHIYTNVIGMKGIGNNTEVFNHKTIKLNGQGIGILTQNGAEGTNNSNINLSSGELDLKLYVPQIGGNGLAYELGKSWANVIGMSAENSKIENSKTGEIELDGSGSGMYGKNNSTLINDGTINIKAKIQYWTDSNLEKKETELPNKYKYPERLVSYGMKIENGGNLINNGTIKFSTEYYISSLVNNKMALNKYSAGIYAKSVKLATNGKNGEIYISGSSAGMVGENGSNLQNDGKIIINSGRENLTDENGNPILGTVGMIGDSGTIVNNGEILSTSHLDTDNVIGILVQDGKAINNGTISIKGNNSVGMLADGRGQVTNKGVINVGDGAYGMSAKNGGKAINDGEINVTAEAKGGMIAQGGTISNNGIINIDKSLGEDKALIADGGTIENKGTINADGNVSIKVGGTYTVGTNSDGTFGKLTANDVNLDGNLVISTDMVAGSYENSYKLDNIIEGNNIKLGEGYKNLSDSLLYDVNTSKDENGNLDGELVRNDNSISDFTNNNFAQVGSLFDKYLTKENYEKLSQADKELVDKIFASTGSVDEIKKATEKLSGIEYLNISRQIFDIKDSFRKYDTSIISTLDKYNYNFTLIGEYGDVQAKDGIVGYDSKMTGFNGAMKLANNLYGTLGYGYSDIDYDNNANGKIQTIHAGLYKDCTYNEADIRAGVFGEYNFHETDRENLDGNVNTDYNSYLVGVTGDISKKYGDSLYIQPRLSLDITYGNVESISEKNLEVKEQEYTSVLPKAEVKVGKKFNNLELFTKSSYSYELGNLDKDMDIKLLNNTVGVENDSMNRGNFDISVGTELSFETLSLSAELGKEFGKRDREYVRAGVTYKF